MQNTITKKQQWAIIAFFLLLIFGFTAGSLLKPDTAVSEEENRDLAQMPELNWEDVLSGAFEKDYETYLSDQFLFRNGWIGLKTSAERAMGKRDVNDIYFAKDGYLIEKHSGIFSSEQAAQNIALLAEFVKTQADRLGTEHVKAMVAPNALLILEDKLPPFADGSAQREYLETLAAALPEGSTVDPAGALLAHKDEYIYYRTDHHWTTLGAWYAYEAWAEAAGLPHAAQASYRREILSDAFFGTVAAKVNVDVQADTIEAWHPQNESVCTAVWNGQEHGSIYDESFLNGRNKYAVFFGGNWGCTEIRTQAGTGRRLLMVKDSYANCFAPFAMQEFDEISMIDMRYFPQSLKEYIEAGDFTDILFLYNASGFAEDVSLAKLLL